MRQYLVEGALGAVTFFPDRTKPVVFEARADGSTSSKIPGRFSICDCTNGNNRRYSKRVWEKNLTPGSTLLESIKRNAAFGLLEHPKDGIVTLLSPISHHVTEAKLTEGKDATGRQIFEVYGTIEILETPEGKKLKALIEGGYNPLVSSRGYGSLEKGSDGVDNVCEDYVCESWDVVIKPSFETAELTPSRTPAPQSEAVKPKSDFIVSEACPHCGEKNFIDAKTCSHCGKPLGKQESISLQYGKQTNVVLSENTTGADAPASSAPTTTKTMDINEIKSRVSGLRVAVESCPADPNRIAALREDIDSIGRQVSQFRAANPSANDWDASKLHRDLDSLSTKLGETASAPAKQAKKLGENNGKLMKVINAVAQTALTYKKKLGEALKTNVSQKKMIEELTRRGQGWQQLAESRKAKFLTMEEDFNTACEALDIMRDRYHEDVTELGRRVIVLEFKEKAETPEIKKSLKEATRLRHIAAIRETLEGKKPVTEDGDDKGKMAGAGQPKEGENATMVKKEGQGKGSGEKGDQVAKEPGNVTHEGKDGKPAAAPVTEGKDAAPAAPAAAPAATPVAEGKILLTTRDPRGITESYEMVRRLSGAAK